MLAEWVNTINGMLGTDFELDESGQLTLEFEGGRRVGVDVPEDGSVYVIYTPVGMLSSPAQLPRLLTAMRLNLYQRATAGGVIALDPASGALVYSFSHPVEHASAGVLARQLDRFVEHADRLQDELEQTAPAAQGFDLELEAMQEDLGVAGDAEAEESENQAELSEPTPDYSGMLRL